jgi:uncharacterized membrane protein
MHLLLLCFFIGVVCGLRAMTAPAVTAWGAHLGWLHFAGTKLSFIANPITLVIFTLAALGEYVADKLPKTPNRTAPGGLIPRILFGAGCAVAIAVSADGSIITAGALGIVGALVGAFGGYNVRHALTANGKLPDLPVALLEDLITIGLGVFVVSHV